MTATVGGTTDTGGEDATLLRLGDRWPSWAPPARAAQSWVRLQVAVERLRVGPPCEFDAEAWWATRATVAGAEMQDAAVEACGWCPVVGLCRDYAVAAREPEGVWGGTTPTERRALRKAAS